MNKIILRILKLFLIAAVMCTGAYASKEQVAGRTFNFINQCPFPVWFGFSPGATPSQNGTPCNTDSDCFSGSVCVARPAGGQCFWKNPTPADGQYKLNANGGTNSVIIPVTTTALNALWSGAIAGRTGCTGSSCQTADCGSGTNGCNEGRGFSQPATQAEFTLLINNSDTYDVEVINGMNIPLSMAPALSLHERAENCKNGSCDQPYFCGNPGSNIPVTNVGRCNWNMVPPSNDYKWVTAGGAACTTDANCASGTVCGISFNAGHTPLLQKTCGKVQGYWTADQICGVQANYGAPFNCQQPLPPPQQNLTLRNLYMCTQVGSCYSNGAPNTCCGCANWDKIGANVPAAPFTKQCNNTNLSWNNSVQNTLLWIKQACPTSYTYPFDDPSSTFTCRYPQTGQNNVNYTVTFCPGGLTGGVSVT